MLCWFYFVGCCCTITTATSHPEPYNYALQVHRENVIGLLEVMLISGASEENIFCGWILTALLISQLEKKIK